MADHVDYWLLLTLTVERSFPYAFTSPWIHGLFYSFDLLQTEVFILSRIGRIAAIQIFRNNRSAFSVLLVKRTLVIMQGHTKNNGKGGIEYNLFFVFFVCVALFAYHSCKHF